MITKPPLPFSKDPIFVDWRRPDIGGLRIAAWTDHSGNPYIGVFILNSEGKPQGMPCWYERQRFLSHVVIGFDQKENPVKVFLDAEVTHRGIQASLQLPWEPANTFFYHRRLFARWDSEVASMGSFANPSNDMAVANYVLSAMPG
ncbi:MAG: hypothetical protein WAO98_06675 [Alphaproteobacteria bacterium]